MKYDFTTVVNRKGTGASKWNLMYEQNPNTPDGIVPFSVADMELKNPPEIVEGLKEYIDKTILGYTNPTDAFYEAVESWMLRRHNWQVEKDWLVYTPGVVSGFFAAIGAFTNVGDGVIVMTPVYYPFYMAIENEKRKIVRNELIYKDGKYSVDFDQLEQLAKNPSNKVLLFSSPHNPVGRVWKPEELKRIGDICNANNVIMLSDEIHNDLIMPGYKHTVYATLGEEYKNNCLVFTSTSKTFNLAGLQGSTVFVPNKQLRETYYNYIFNNFAFMRMNMIATKAFEIAYNSCEKWLTELIDIIETNYKVIKDFMAENFPKAHVVDLEGTYLVWIDFRAYGIDEKELERIMQQEAYMFLDEGYIFGPEGSGFERINIACPTKVIEDAMLRMKNALDKYI